jgi:hypothetical protein
MRTWFALIFAPSIALAVQSVMYALVTPSCSTQTRVGIHGSAAVALLAAVALTALAWSDWRARSVTLPQGPDCDHGDPTSSRRFLAVVATAVAAISCLVILAMWVGAWVLSPCSEQ